MSQERPIDIDELSIYIETKRKTYTDRLSSIVAIKSVSATPENRQDVVDMMDWAQDFLDGLGFTTEKKELGAQEGYPNLQLPPVIFASKGNDPNLKTLMIYGHLDVQPASHDDGWDQPDPFVTVQKNGNIYGRGTTDDKGPVLDWMNCLEAIKQLNMKVPVNLKFLLEGMEESGSEGLDDLIETEKQKPNNFFDGVDYVCISDNYWLGTEKPCLTYGLRGVAYFMVEVVGGTKDLHSGTYGGTVYEALSDLIHILDSLVDVNGKILIDGVSNSVDDVTQAELDSYKGIDFNLDEYKTDGGVDHLIHSNKINCLMHRWRYPSLSIHGIEGAFSDPGQKTVIPRSVIGKFSIRLVPSQNPTVIDGLVKAHIQKVHRLRGSPNALTVTCGVTGKPWVSDNTNENFDAGKKAVQKVYSQTPDLTREGGSIPVTLTIQEATGTNVMLLPIGQSDDGAHSQNEKMSINNYINGIKVMGAYMDELSKLPTPSKAKKFKGKK